MKNEYAERRRYTRIFFSPEDNMSGKIRMADGSMREFSVHLMNISAGGLAFRPMDGELSVNEGDKLLLTGITGRKSMEISDEIELVVRWTAAIPACESFGAGVEFVNISDEMRARIEDFMKMFG
jgi:c-di-GMP-binding flagellar brake protein YcgR